MDAEIPNDALVEDDQESLTDLQREQVKLLSQEFYDLFGDDETLDSVILSSERNRTEIWLAFKIKYPWVASHIERVFEVFFRIDRTLFEESELETEKPEDPFSYLTYTIHSRVTYYWRRSYNILLSTSPSRAIFSDTIGSLNRHRGNLDEYWNEFSSLIKAKMSHLSEPIPALQESLEGIESAIGFLNKRHASLRTLENIYKEGRVPQKGCSPKKADTTF
ncbi:MAG: hypothetical protein M1813_002079 [Trichoglossum hirsutum]|nr:MAG: hypothetical protein M1813_002079 [Trichoglossum hirsutum]